MSQLYAKQGDDMLNLFLYYPRLITALVFRPLPTSHVTLQHWVMAHIFLLWNTPWRRRYRYDRNGMRGQVDKNDS